MSTKPAGPASHSVDADVAESSSDDESQLNLTDDDGWNDVDDQEDKQPQKFKCLFYDVDQYHLDDVIEYDRNMANFDLIEEVARLDLDFLGVAKLINYIRDHTKNNPDGHPEYRKELFEDEKYLIPVLEDDALLLNIDDILEQASRRRQVNPNVSIFGGQVPIHTAPNPEADATQIANLQDQLARVRHDFDAYKELVSQTLDQRWNSESATSTQPASADTTKPPPKDDDKTDNTYFDSYAHHSIHETMLKDTTRTNSYMHFIYGHKSLFHQKTVLDVGCGTGILSFFCARAGATHVHAVDNSPIISRAQEIAVANDMQRTVSFHRGKVEDLPELEALRGKVDVLVSEWMGYALLYEGMLDSVIAARDLYLRPPSSADEPGSGGLMVPSHCTLHLAPCEDAEYVSESVGYWRDVYGFDYRAFTADPGFHTDATIRDVPSRALVAEPTLLKTFALQHVKASELDFASSFRFALTRDIESLDGFVVWFDSFFLPPPHNMRKELPDDVDGGKWKGPGVAFTTGPRGRELTHWQMCWLGVDRSSCRGMERRRLAAGVMIEGEIEVRKGQGEGGKRELSLSVAWTAKDGEKVVESGKQMWLLR